MRTPHLRAVSAPQTLQVALYARVSSDQQAEHHTIDSQLAELTARAEQDGHCIRDDLRFIDNGHSGASLIRPALERLRDLVALSAIDLVYVHAPDRLARSYAHQVLLIEEFTQAGTQVVFLNRPIGTTPEDSLLLQLQGMFAEYERAKVLERSRRGKRHRAQTGAVSVLSRAPFGYRYITREAGGGAARYEIDEEAARIVRQIFTWVGHERLTLAGVCRRLHDSGLPSPTGRRHWSRAMIHTHAAQPRLCGTGALWSPPERAVAAAASSAARPRWPAAAALAASARPARTAHQHRGASHCRRRPLCECRRAVGGEPQTQSRAACGRPVSAARPAGLPEVRLWVHRASPSGAVALLSLLRHRPQPLPRCVPVRCPAGRHGSLDEAVWTEVCRLLDNPARVIAEYQRRLDAVQATPHRLELDALDRQLAKARRAIERLIDSYTEGLIEKPEFEPRLAELRRRTARLEAEAKAQQEADEQVRSLHLVIGKLDLFAAMVHDRLAGADWATKRDIICTLVKRIEVADDVVRVIFRVDPGFSGPPETGRTLHHCPTRRHPAPDVA